MRTPSRLAQDLGRSPAATAALVDRLEAAGLVEERVRDRPDRGQIRLQLSRASRLLGAELLHPWAERTDRAADGLSAAEAAFVASSSTRSSAAETALSRGR